MKILGICGSLRKASFNRAALKEAQRLVPSGVELELFTLDGIPPFSEDDEQNLPETVVALKEKVRAADALLFATPEYNYSIPGVLKNAIDWGTRPSGDNCFAGKPAAIMGASLGRQGTARAQYHLRQVFVTLDVYPINGPELMIANASESFDEEGRLTDKKALQMIERILSQLVEWTKRISK
jgi:chromate reductase